MLELNKIYNMDCLDGMKQMEDNSVNITITSPPYNANLRLSNGKFSKINDKCDQRSKYIGFDDALQPLQYFEWQSRVIREMLRVTKNYVFYNIQLLSSNKLALFKLFGEFSEQIKEVFIWDKGFGEPAIQEGVVNSVFEFVIVFSKNDSLKRSFAECNFKRGKFQNMLRIGKNFKNKISNYNSALMPITLPRKLILAFSREEDIVFDPFSGSGTTAKASKELNRKWIGFEISPEYCKIAEKRLSQETMSSFFGDST